MVYFRGHFRPSEAEIAYFREHLLKQILQRSLHDTPRAAEVSFCPVR